MTSQRSLVVLAAAAALLAAGCASSGTKTGAAKPGARAPAAKPAAKPATTAKAGDPKAPAAKAPEAKPAEAKPAEAKPADPKAAPAAKAPEAKPVDPKAAPATGKPGDPKAVGPGAGPTVGAPATAGRGFWGSYDEYMKKQGTKLNETKFLGLQIVPNFKDEISFTDNVYYQDSNEKLIVNRDPDGDAILATPGLGQPRGEVSDIVNTATLGIDLDMPLNLSLVPILGMGSDKVTILGGSITSVEYFLHSDSPDALNWEFHMDLPALINSMVSRLLTVDAAKHAFYVRLEGDYSVISDPLDVAKLDFSGAAPTFNNVGERSSFRRTEYWLKGTAGWKGPIFDSKITYRHYRLQLEDNSLKPADHYERESYAEIGHHLKRSEHRIYGFGEYTTYNFDNRGTFDPTNPNEEDTQALRDFAKIRTGLGWEGPIVSKKIRGGAELYYLATNVFHEGPYWNHPIDITIGTGGAVVDSAGNVQRQRFDERGMVAGKANLAYRPFVTKGTQLQAEYERNVDFSVVAQDKVIDRGSITFTHPINERLTGEAYTGATMENMQHREKRLYTEFGIGARYRIAAYTELSLRYSLRHMRSRHEPVTTQSDAINEPYLVKADGDFTANIVSLGITIQF